MFSFHKPKIYRSHMGCCICRAKSSSSRFTDSKKYEPEFEKCFRTAEKRSGEICNACVLLVKRWKKLPSGTTRNWQHVVDARAGPGTKSFKNKPISCSEPKKRVFAKPSRPLCKDSKIHLQPLSSSESESEDDDEEMMDDLDGLENGSNNSSRITGTGMSSSASSRGQRSLRRSNRLTTGTLGSKHFNRNGNSAGRSVSGTDRNNNLSGKVKNIPKRRTLLTPEHLFSFLDTSFWQKEKVCCGVIFKGPNNEVLIYPELLDSLCGCRKSANFSASVSPSSAVSSECESRLTSSPTSSPIKSAPSASPSSQIPSLVSVSSVLAAEAQPTSLPPPPPPPPAFHQHSSDEANKSISQAEEHLLALNSKKTTLQHQDSFPSSDSSSERGGNSSSHETDTDDPSSGVSSMAACDETSMLVPDTDHPNHQLNHHHLEQLATMALADRHHLSTVSKVCALMMEHVEDDDEDGGSSSSSTASTTTDDGLNHHEMEMEAFSEEASSSPVKASSSEAVVVLSTMATAVV
ncbi:Protein Family fam60a [Tyrophagus putrescentiae]|nr:Protein Family fam60a [Tyrophagus putrescentiae]